MDKQSPETPLSVREKLFIKFTMMLLKMLRPYEYEHQYTEIYKDIDRILKGEHGQAN